MRGPPIIAAMAVFILCFVSAAPSGYLSALYKLNRAHGETKGVITVSLPNSHGSVMVHYSVSGVACDRVIGGPAPLGPGDAVKVYHSLDDPKLSQVSEPSIFDVGVIFLTGFSLAVAVVAGFLASGAGGSLLRSR